MTHDTNRASRAELHNEWTIADVCEAHDVLDAIDAAREEARKKQGD